MPYETLKIEKEDGIAVINLNSPPVNPLNTQRTRSSMMRSANLRTTIQWGQSL